MMPSNHLILCRPLLLLPSVFPSIRVFSNESALHIRWPKYWSFCFSIFPIYFTHSINSVYMSIPISQFIPTLLLPWYPCICSLHLSLYFCFANKIIYIIFTGFLRMGKDASVVKNLPAIQKTQETWVRSLGQEDHLEEEVATYMQYSCLKNPMNRGAWRATVQRVGQDWSTEHTPFFQFLLTTTSLGPSSESKMKLLHSSTSKRGWRKDQMR